MHVLVLTIIAVLVFLLQPLFPVVYSHWIIMVIAAVWGYWKHWFTLQVVWNLKV